MTEPAFELERFRWSADDRMELRGRWRGIRGVFFVRPTLVLVRGDAHRRLLALLDGKPWHALEGRPWSVTFPWDGQRFDAEAAELSVAPGIVVPLPPPEGAPVPDAAGAVRAPVAAGRSRGIVQRALAADRLETELLRERGQREGLARERDGLVRERDRLRRERDALQRERDAAIARRDAAVRERDAAVRERDGALVVRERLERERAGLLAARDELRRQRDESAARGAS